MARGNISGGDDLTGVWEFGINAVVKSGIARRGAPGVPPARSATHPPARSDRAGSIRPTLWVTPQIGPRRVFVALPIIPKALDLISPRRIVESDQTTDHRPHPRLTKLRQTVLRYDPAGRAGPAPNARRSRCSARPSAQRNGLMLVMNCSIISMRTNSSSPMSSMV